MGLLCIYEIDPKHSKTDAIMCLCLLKRKLLIDAINTQRTIYDISIYSYFIWTIFAFILHNNKTIYVWISVKK